MEQSVAQIEKERKINIFLRDTKLRERKSNSEKKKNGNSER